jgi:hypothetical protein
MIRARVMAEDLRKLEREVETARAKLMGDIAALRAPGGLTDLPETLKQAALEKRDSFVEEARARSRSVVETIREKAVANPAAALVIGAGLAWHFLRRPPIAIALVGGGLFSLLRTPVDASLSGRRGDELERTKQNLKTQAGELGSQAAELGRQAGRSVEEKAAELARDARTRAAALAADAQDKAADMIDEARDRASELVEEARGKASSLADEAKAAIARTPLGRFVSQDEEEPAMDDLFDNGEEEVDTRGKVLRTDTLMLGAAGIALGAAIAVLYQRRQNEPVD